MAATWIDVPEGRVLRQLNETNCCGYCCVAMVVRLITSQELSPETVLREARSQPGYINWRGGADLSGAVPTVAVQMGAIASVGEGSYGGHLQHVLRTLLNEYCPINHVTAPNVAFHETKLGELKKTMRKVKDKKPLIVRIEWPAPDLGGHWVVVSGRKTRGWGKASDYTILDPIGNISKNRGSTNFHTVSGNATYASKDPPYLGDCYYVTVGI